MKTQFFPERRSLHTGAVSASEWKNLIKYWPQYHDGISKRTKGAITAKSRDDALRARQAKQCSAAVSNTSPTTFPASGSASFSCLPHVPLQPDQISFLPGSAAAEDLTQTNNLEQPTSRTCRTEQGKEDVPLQTRSLPRTPRAVQTRRQKL